LFQAGDPERARRIHFFFAGEDARETAGVWVADAMIRRLCEDTELLARLTRDEAVCIAPLVSAYTAVTPAPSYRTIRGEDIYGAATWADADPPDEYRVCRDLAVDAIETGRLGLLLTIHSWQSQDETTGMQTIRSAGDNRLTESRVVWARNVMETMMDGVPRGGITFPEKIWHPGLARDYLLAAHDTATFRVEITTWDQGMAGFQETGHRFIENLAALTDWSGLHG
jgi:hypothetical protein